MARLEFKNMKKWEKAINSGVFQKNLRKNIKKATLMNAQAATAEQRRVISSGSGLTKNANLTEALKGQNKPLVGEGDLFQSITQRSVDDFTAFSGVFKTDSNYNIAVIAHEGATIKVTPAMRGMFFMLFKASEAAKGNGEAPELTGRAAELFAMNRNWAPLSQDTEAIVIPPRPWVAKAFQSPTLRSAADRNWSRAVQQTFREGKQ